MKAILFIFTISIWSFGFSVTGQTLPTIHPTILESNVFKKADQIIWQKALDQYAKVESGEIDYETLCLQDKSIIDSLERGIGPMTEGIGCSWYCGGGPYKITSTSFLKNQGETTYYPENIHDFNLFTAWIPDNKKSAIGTKINFHFKPFEPRVTDIIIWNGYMKNIDLWNANSRVAKFKLFINGSPKAILELKDLNNTQSFSIDPVQSIDSIKDLILTLEIIEIFKGSKYEDVVVSEINFDGLDVHCFGEGTQITMADGSSKSIELLKSGDLIMSFDTKINHIIQTEVANLVSVKHSNILRLKFADRKIIVTDDHPFWTAGKEWASINPVKSNQNYLQESEIQKLQIGDKVFNPSDKTFVELMELETVDDVLITYTLELKSASNFIANGLLVKTEKLKCMHHVKQ